jgi:hypothetical protein
MLFSLSPRSAKKLPAPPPFLRISRRDTKGGCYAGRSMSPGDAGFACYADWALHLPPIGDNFKKNQTYDFELLPLTAAGRGLLPRVATPGNTSACLAAADGDCLPGFGSVFFEYFVGAAVEFGYRPYIEEAHGAILVTLDASLGPATVTATIAGVAVEGVAAPGEGSLIPFSLAELPAHVDEPVSITVLTHTDQLEFVHERIFIRAAPPRAGSAATTWQVDHSRTGLRVDGKRFFGTGWFGAGGMQGVGSGLPPNAFLPYISGGSFTISDSALRQAALLSEWGKMGVTLVRVGAMFTSGGGPNGWSEASEAEALREFRFVADAAHAAGIYLIADLPIQAWGNALGGIPVSQANWTTVADWERWTLGVSLPTKMTIGVAQPLRWLTTRCDPG